MLDDALPPDLSAQDWVFPAQCPVCAAPASHSTPFERAESEMGLLQYAVCGECGLVYQAPHPSTSYLRSYYQGGYHLHMHGQSDPSAKTEWAESKRAEALVAFARPYLSSVRNHLDVGSSLGKLLAGFKDVFACQSHGVEPAVVFRQNARALGVDVVGSLADLDPGLARSYDLVSLSHVLEHMTDPLGTLRLFHQEWMSEGSHLLVEVPNLYGHPSLEFAHLFAFTKASLVEVLRQAEFFPLAIEIHGHPHSRRLPFYVRALARREANTKARPVERPSVTLIRLKRRLGMLGLRAAWAVSSRLLGRARLSPWET